MAAVVVGLVMHSAGQGISIMGRCAVNGEFDQEVEGAAAGNDKGRGRLGKCSASVYTVVLAM